MATTITVTLPDTIYVRIQEAAHATAMTQDEVLTQSVALTLPELEVDLPDELRTEFRAMSLASDTKLWEVAHSQMDKNRQRQLEQLANLQKERALTLGEQTTLSRLFNEAELVMLRKAEAFAVLARHGYKIFLNTEH
ncbi:MAG: hypothetical protein DYG89_40920 [Caldilinea sp. CFX5]|nr:hypothetical protein [Caldilinea sp. CFX5]